MDGILNSHVKPREIRVREMWASSTFVRAAAEQVSKWVSESDRFWYHHKLGMRLHMGLWLNNQTRCSGYRQNFQNNGTNISACQSPTTRQGDRGELFLALFLSPLNYLSQITPLCAVLNTVYWTEKERDLKRGYPKFLTELTLRGSSVNLIVVWWAYYTLESTHTLTQQLATSTTWDKPANPDTSN